MTVPLKGLTPTPNKKYGSLNDDKAEKRRRRKSAAEQLRRKSIVGGQESATEESAQAARRVSQARRLSGRRVSLAGATTSVPQIPLDIMNTNFEEWIKMATDNKINAANSWNFALIDYFHDMSLLKEGNSINFQKASCTLDGCIKIYTSRVDSVVTETGKLLSGLAQNKAKAENTEDIQEENEEQEEKRAKKKSSRSENTLVKDYSSLTLKKFDLEFAVDPLFKKTSADFDEGGARGLLLNHLSIDANGQIIFDASDAMAEGDDDKDDDMDTDQADIGPLRAFIPSAEDLELKDICPSLKHFTFTTASSEFGHLLKAKAIEDDSDHDDSDDDDDDAIGGMALFRDPNPMPSTMANPFQEPDYDTEQAFSAFAVADSDDHGMMPDMGIDEFDDDDERRMTLFAAPRQPVAGPRGTAAAPRPLMGQFDYVMAMANEDDNLFSYFDTKFMKNWAGPEHWKMSRVAPSNNKDEPQMDAAARKANRKEPLMIDFVNGEDVSESVLFAEAKPPSSILLPKSARSNGAKNLLPDDMHFNSKQLLRLFLKPSRMLQARQRFENGPRGDVDADMQFWATQALDAEKAAADALADHAVVAQLQTPGMPGYSATFDAPQGGYDDDDIDEDAVAMPIADDFGATPGHGLPLLTADTETTISSESTFMNTNADTITAAVAKFIKPEYVNYARVAKRVDVRKLKENIWRELRLPAKASTGENRDPLKEETKPDPAKMNLVLKGLSHRYPEQKRKDISTSFCFICLLHLANEKGLSIQGGTQQSDEQLPHVNMLDSLVVYKE